MANFISEYGILLMLLICPLMHLFMHKGMHGGHGKHCDKTAEKKAPNESSQTTHIDI